MSLFGDILGFGGSIFNSVSSSKANKQALKQQWKIYEDQKEYNKPINQMARLQEAGLNPNLVYGGLSAGAGNVNSMPNVGMSTYGGDIDFSKLGNMPENFLNFGKKSSERRILKAQEEGALLNLDIQRAILDKTIAETNQVKANTGLTNAHTGVVKHEKEHYDTTGYDKNMPNWAKGLGFVSEKIFGNKSKREQRQKNIKALKDEWLEWERNENNKYGIK